jgi:hypothetical protein
MIKTYLKPQDRFKEVIIGVDTGRREGDETVITAIPAMSPTDRYTVKQLRAMAKDAGKIGYSKMKEAELLEL